MNKKTFDQLKNERQIPDKVLIKLEMSREDILNKKIKQEKSFKLASKSMGITVLVAAVITLILITKTPVGMALEKALGIGRDAGIATVENNGISTQLNLTSVQNGREITLTKFVSTKKKFAFDYQFKVNDEKLKSLLKKNSTAKSDYQDIQIGLFAEGSNKDLFGGVNSYSTFRFDEDTFYGSVVSSFDTENIPEEAKLSLHIYRLAWIDQSKYETAKSEALSNPDDSQSFTVDTALEYVGDWRFDIEYQPLNQAAQTKVIDSKNVTNIVSKSDALQTTITFNAPMEYPNSPEITVYKNDVVIDNRNINFREQDTGKYEIELDLSALDKTSIYKVKIKEADIYGNIIKETGYFEVQNI